MSGGKRDGMGEKEDKEDKEDATRAYHSQSMPRYPPNSNVKTGVPRPPPDD